MPTSRKVLAVIPARWASARFPGKPITEILGKPMVQWVLEQVQKASLVSEIVVATDDQRICDAVHKFGGEVLPSKIREYGRANLSFVDSENKLLNGVSSNSQVWMSHGDTIATLPKNYKSIASTNDVEVAAYIIENESTYGLQFHPEVYHTKDGTTILKNFLVDICDFSQDFL